MSEKMSQPKGFAAFREGHPLSAAFPDDYRRLAELGASRETDPVLIKQFLVIDAIVAEDYEYYLRTVLSDERAAYLEQVIS